MKNKWYFVSAIKGEKNDRKYSLVSISNGLRTVTVNNPNDIKTDNLSEGDEVKVEFDLSISYRNELEPVLKSLVLAK